MLPLHQQLIIAHTVMGCDKQLLLRKEVLTYLIILARLIVIQRVPFKIFFSVYNVVVLACACLLALQIGSYYSKGKNRDIEKGQ